MKDTYEFGFFNDKNFEYFEDHIPDIVYGKETSADFFETFSEKGNYYLIINFMIIFQKDAFVRRLDY